MYLYFFVHYTGTLVITSNTRTYRVALFAPSLARTIEHDCIDERCELFDLPPVTYNMQITASGYTPYAETIDIEARTMFERTVELQKKVEIVSLDTEVLSTKEKIERLKLQKQHDATIFTQDGEPVFLDIYDTEVSLYLGDLLLAMFPYSTGL
ncbi:MAG: hypothetical protein H6767_04555 [Candidatus Peribacteria bacterium]|nr:MAG: hypothetical protein H6767_04555 [Candidatus Peribacteria bacterium]